MKNYTVPVLVVVGLTLGACGGDDDGGDGDGDGLRDASPAVDGGGGGSDAGGGVPGVAHVVQGATPPPSSKVARAAGLLADGKWYASPDKVRIKLTRINFAGATAQASTGADLVDCVVTYDRAAQTLDALLDCPFEIAPGTYTSMNLFVDPTAEVLISDPANGIFTDPAAPGGLSPTEPTAGAAFVPVTATMGGGFEQFFPTPLVVTAGAPVSLAVVVDAVQTAEITASGAGSTLTFGTYFPAVAFPTIGGPGVPQYYTSAGTASTYNDSLFLANIVRVYHEPGGAPVYVVFQQRAGALSLCTQPAGGIGAYAADPAQTPANVSGHRAGGWLGLDAVDQLCWAYATDGTYATYTNFITMARVDTIGQTTVVHCEQTAAPTPPSAGATYASGCPAIVNEHSSGSLTLVAQ